MSLKILGQLQTGKLNMGQNGRIHQWGQLQWNATDKTGEIPVQLRQVECVFFFPAGQPAADEVFWAPQVAGGRVIVPASGTITLNRESAAPTNNLVGSYLVIGL